MLLGKSRGRREWLVEHSGRLTIIKGNWKYIEPGQGEKLYVNTNTESGNDTLPQLYNLGTDLGEKNNVASENVDIVNELSTFLNKIKDEGRTAILKIMLHRATQRHTKDLVMDSL